MAANHNERDDENHPHPKPHRRRALVALAVTTTVAQSADPLPSWNDGAAKKSIVEFVAKVTKEGSPDFVPPAERIATFDNDGTLWAEQPMYFQFAVRARPRQGARTAASRMEGQGAVRLAAQRRLKGALAGGEPAIVRDRHGDAHRHDDRRVREDREGLARHGEASEDQAALHRDGLSADARAARLPARERLQDVHRLRRRHRVHAPVDGEGLRHPARAGRRQQRQDSSSRCATASPCS